MVNPGRMQFEQLLLLQEALDEMWVSGVLSLDDYDSEWLSVLHAAGYSEEEYGQMIDDRWDRLDVLRSVKVERFEA